jgi:hypothetical protein
MPGLWQISLFESTVVLVKGEVEEAYEWDEVLDTAQGRRLRGQWEAVQ